MIHCRLDYCNSVLSNQPMYVYNNLQSVLRTAARLVMKLPGYASVTEVMKKDLHWLGFPQRISYKLCTLTYKCLHGMASEYLSRHFTLVSSVDGRSHLRSAAAGHLVVPISKTKTIGTKSFYYSAPIVWNSLPLAIVWLFSDLWKFQKTTENLLVSNWLTHFVHCVRQCDVLH